jgi:hypothetical protein
MVALRELEDDSLYENDALPGVLLAATRLNYVLVVGVYEKYVTVVPLGVRERASDPDAFAALAAAADGEPRWIRVPPPHATWDGHALAYLFMPHTVSREMLADRRVATMEARVRPLVAARFAAAFEDDGG